jgi:hypothetical protein
MRRLLLPVLAMTLLLAPAMRAHAQYQGGMGGGGMGGGSPSGAGPDDDESEAKSKRDKEWNDTPAPLRGLKNAGPCPFAKTLYDAGRYVEFKNAREASAEVTYSGEIQGVSAGCAYKGEEPIKATMDILFELGRGPMAEGASKTYRYWVAVTDRNHDVIAKRTFDLPVKFPAGKDRVYITETIGQVLIPRAGIGTSGANFEILVGFEVTPQMADFNRQGKRFRANAGTTAVASGADTQGR